MDSHNLVIMISMFALLMNNWGLRLLKLEENSPFGVLIQVSLFKVYNRRNQKQLFSLVEL
jgi:hypothetical protein